MRDGEILHQRTGPCREGKADIGPLGRRFRLKDDLVPKHRHQQHEKQARRIRPCQLAIKHRELADGEEGGRKQAHLAVEPLPPYNINKVYGGDAHQHEGQLHPQLAPAEEPHPAPEKQLHPDGMAVGHDALLDEVVEVVEAGAQQGAELVVHERHLA